MTRLNVYAGLASGYLLRDENDPGDGSRLPGPPYEVPLILQDKMFNDDGTLAYPPNSDLHRPWARSSSAMWRL
jgi:spore coat protein A, manganese oxidase